MNRVGTPAEGRYLRQTILPGVGPEGQARWNDSTFWLAGDGPALEAARIALTSSGASARTIPSVDALPSDPANLPVLVLAPPAAERRAWSRSLRRDSRSALFAWPCAGGYALAFFRHSRGACPCLECFETQNPKAFGRGEPAVLRALGAAAASEALLGVLRGDAPLEGKILVFTGGQRSSILHPTGISLKCPASLRDAGAGVFP